MKILGILGSRRKHGNTSTLINQTLAPFKTDNEFQVETIYLGDLDIEACRGCEGCATTNKCVIKDDMQNITKKLLDADAIIAGSPTYFYNITSDMKKFIDRCYCLFTFDKNDRSSYVCELELKKQKYAAIIAVSEQESLDDMGFTAEAMELSFKSMGYRITSIQKAIHVFKAGEINKSGKELKQAEMNGKKLFNTLNLSKIREKQKKST